MNNIKKWAPEVWTPAEWEIFQNKLQQLDMDTLAKIAHEVGIVFHHANINKDEYLSVLDESEKNELIIAYKKATEKK